MGWKQQVSVTNLPSDHDQPLQQVKPPSISSSEKQKKWIFVLSGQALEVTEMVNRGQQMKLDTFRHTCDIGHHIQIRIMADFILGALLASASPKYMKEKYWSIEFVVVGLFVFHYGGKTPSRNSLREKVLFILTFCLFYFLILKLKCNHIILPFSSLPPTPPTYSPCPFQYMISSLQLLLLHTCTHSVYILIIGYWITNSWRRLFLPLSLCAQRV